MNDLSAYTIPQSARLIDAVAAIKESQNRCVVVTSDERVVGVISEGDLMRALLADVDIHAPLEDWINHGFKFLRNVDYEDALALMHEHGITMVPVIDESFQLTAVITLSEVLQRVELKPTS